MKYPLQDFRNCKAYRHAASCLELQLLSQLAFDLIYNQSINLKEIEVMVKDTYTLYHSSFKSDLLIKFAILAAEMYELLDRLEQSAAYFQRIASEI